MEEKKNPDLILQKSLFWQPDYLDISAWTEHLPFAFWIIEMLKPNVLVELGVHNGTSYFSFCQAVKTLDIQTTCYAVDTWEGDEHAGFYSDAVFKKVEAYNSAHYSRFSTLIKSSFDQAVEYFLDGSIELLHIDGLHTYEAVKHDFETWFPKLSPDAVVIFHDINVRERQFGVFKFWNELKEKYRHLQFDFGHGLGIIATGKIQGKGLEDLFTGNDTSLYFFLRNFFSERGRFFKINFENSNLIKSNNETLSNLNSEISQANEKYNSLELSYGELSEKSKNLEAAHNHIHQQYLSLFQSHSELYENQKSLLTEIENLKKINGDSKRHIEQLKENINTLRLINKQLVEKYKISVSELSDKMTESGSSVQKLNAELSRHIKTIEDLQVILQNQSQSIEWYKRTYEDRSLPGIIIEKFKTKRTKKSTGTVNTGGILNLKINKKSYPMVPVNDLKFLPESRTYIVPGPDPHFIAEFKSEKIKAGWYLFSIEVVEIKGILHGTKIYFDYGKGFNETDVWNLPHVHENKIECLIRFAHDLDRLRFDPSTGMCGFEIKKISLKPFSKLNVLITAIHRYKRNYNPNLSYLRIYMGLIIDYLRSGRSGIREKVWSSIKSREDHSLNTYSKWCLLYDSISRQQLDMIKERSAKLPYKPLFSVIMPVYNAPLVFLQKAIDSVRKQAYENWELCIADDKSPNKKVIKLLTDYQAIDPRIKVVFRDVNGHISNASNSAIEIASGDYLVLMDQDDVIPPHSLYLVAKAINENRELELIYSDEDKIDEQDQRFDPYFKTDWNKDLFYGQNMINHLAVYKHSLIKKIGGFRTGYEGSQDYDLALRCIENLRDDQIHHIPHILYHWRAAKGSTSVTVSNKSYAMDAGIKALNDHLKRTNRKAAAEKNINNSYRVKWALPEQQPMVSIIIPTKDKVDVLATCIESIFEKTDYSNFEVLIVDNNSEEASTQLYLKYIQNQNKQVRVYNYSGSFNFSAINNFGVKQSKGDIILLLNNDTEVINRDWLIEIASQCMREEIGVVGAKLYYPNGLIQHAGVFLSEGHPGIHIYLKRDKNDAGYINKLNLVQNYSAVTAACFAVRKELFLKVGGLNEKNLKVAYNDVDFCLKVKEAGYKNLWTPFAQLIHYESLSRGDDLNEINLPRFKQEQGYMLSKWKEAIRNDPFFNPNLDIDTQTTQYSFPPKIKYEWQENATD